MLMRSPPRAEDKPSDNEVLDYLYYVYERVNNLESISSRRRNEIKKIVIETQDDLTATSETLRQEFSVADGELQSTISKSIETTLEAYSTTTQMNTAIKQSADSINLTVSKSITETKTYADNAANTAESNAKADTAEKLEAYSTTTQMNTAIKLATEGISLVVTKTTDGNVVNTASIVAAINGDSNVTIQADRINLSGYVTATSLSTSGATKIDGSNITTGTISAKRLDLSGYVTVASLSTKNATVINGSNITTGTISADRINTDELKVKTIYSSDLNKASIKGIGLDTLYIGGDGTWNYDNLYILAGEKAFFGYYNDTTLSLVFDTIKLSVYGNKKGFWSIGTEDSPMKSVHTDYLYLDGKNVGYLLYDKTGETFKMGGSYNYIACTTNNELRPGTSTTSASLGTSVYPWSKTYTDKLYTDELYLDNKEITTILNDRTGETFKMGSGVYGIVCNTSNELRPEGASTTWLGTLSYPWDYAYIGENSAQIGTRSSSLIGFFGATPRGRGSISSLISSATLDTAVSKINDIISFLKNIGLIS